MFFITLHSGMISKTYLNKIELLLLHLVSIYCMYFNIYLGLNGLNYSSLRMISKTYLNSIEVLMLCLVSNCCIFYLNLPSLILYTTNTKHLLWWNYIVLKVSNVLLILLTNQWINEIKQTLSFILLYALHI